MRSLAARLALGGAILAGASGPSSADDVSGYVELSSAASSSKSEIAGVPTTETDTTSFRPRLYVLWNRKLFPHLQAQAGWSWERTDDRFEQLTSDQDPALTRFRPGPWSLQPGGATSTVQETEVTRFRPFFRLTMRSPQVLGEIGWDRNEETTRTDDLSRFRLTRDSLLTTLGWYPVDLPSARLELSRVVDSDGSGKFVDRTEKALRFTSEYAPVSSVRFYYRGALDRVEDRIDGTAFRTTQHNGQARFSDLFFDSRWEVSGSWNTTFRSTRVESSGTGEILVPVFPVGGSFAIDDTPDVGSLAPAPPLVDGNTLVATSINLGLVPPAGDDRPRNFGVDLGLDRDVNVFRVWVDRNLPFDISRTFTWEIWTSTDAQFWARASVIPTAPFGPFDNRFELRFPGVLARYVKVVVAPLAPTVANATSWPSILVTELEPLLAQPASRFEQTVSDTRHLANASSRLRILERPGLWYETTYSLVTSERGATSWTLSNGLSARHQFDQVWGMSARAAREDGLDRDRERTAFVYSAAITANPFETLRNSLIVSGYVDETDGRTIENRGVNFNTTAIVYDGVDLNLLAGRSHGRTADGLTNDVVLVGAGATLVPYRTLTITLRYDDRNATISTPGGDDSSLRCLRGSSAEAPSAHDLDVERSRCSWVWRLWRWWDEPVDAQDREDRTRSVEAGVAYNPVPAIYLYGSRRKEARTSQLDRTVDTFASSWSPFPGGALQLSVSYNEIRYSDLDEIDTSFVPFVRWNINPRSYLEFAYQALTRESDVARLQDDILTSTLRIGF